MDTFTVSGYDITVALRLSTTDLHLCTCKKKKKIYGGPFCPVSFKGITEYIIFSNQPFVLVQFLELVPVHVQYILIQLTVHFHGSRGEGACC